MSRKRRGGGQKSRGGTNTSGRNTRNDARASRKNQNDGTNRQYKDRLFKALFGSEERKNLTLELYNALRGSSYTNPEEIELTTIDDVVYMGMRNDVSFVLRQTMNLWEQQSTPNPNMPLRLHLYYSHVMESYLQGMNAMVGSIYSSRLMRIPTPRVVLFYNGPGRMPEYLYLSDAYEDNSDPDIELRVHVININSGQDRILELCRPLKDYTTFVEAFRRYQEMDGIHSRMAASKAISELPEGTVKNYLMAHEAEVLDMILTEYDEDKTLKAEYYAGRTDGYATGVAETEARYEVELAAKDIALASKDDEIARLKAQLSAMSQS